MLDSLIVAGFIGLMGGAFGGWMYSLRPNRPMLVMFGLVPLLVTGFFGVMVADPGAALIGSAAGWIASSEQIFLCTTLAFVFAFLIMRRISPGVARRPVETINDADCARCGYPLRGLAEARCPECGQPFDWEHPTARDE